MATHTRGAPYPSGSDPNDAAAWLNTLALWVNERPGVTAATTTQINAMSGVDRWDGRLVVDTTIDRVKRWDAGTSTWVTLPDSVDIAALLATTGLPAALSTAGSRGVSSSAARADHVHPFPAVEQINTVSGSPLITLGTNVSNTGDGTVASRRGFLTTLEVYVLAGATVSTLLQMPTGWRPPYSTRAVMNHVNNNQVRAVLLGTDGTLTVEGSITSGQVIYGHITYVVA